MSTCARDTGGPAGPTTAALQFEGPDGPTARRADAVVLALGGASWPTTGSDGNWVDPVTSAGVVVTPLRPANSGVDIEWTPLFAERFAGTPVKNVAVRCGEEWTRAAS